MQPKPSPKRLSAIFLDLDETLIHSTTGEEALPGSTPFGPYHVVLRPCARDILALCRSKCKSTMLCTTATREYAYGISKLFGFGFRQNEILGLEHLLAGSVSLAPQSVLIDNLPATNPQVKLKARVLGIPRDQILNVPSFHGGDEPVDLVLLAVRDFLDGFVH